jgi:hypothetical protein
VYGIRKHDSHLVVEFEGDFDLPMVQTIIHHVTLMPEYVRMNDIWFIGNHHSRISLCDLETLATEFRCMCPGKATREKTAIVVEQGLTEAILELWMGTARTRVPFEMKIFHTLQEAEAWLGVAESKVA